MLTTEQAIRTQTLIEHEALIPIEPDHVEDHEIDDDNGRRIVRGDNAYTTAPEAVKPTYDEYLDLAVQSELKGFVSWLNFKIKNELILQIYKDGADSISIANVAASLQSLFQNEQLMRNATALELDQSRIPDASPREELVATGRTEVAKEDLEMYHIVQIEMADQVAAMEPKNKDDYFMMAAEYVNRLLADAKEEVRKIKLEQGDTRSEAQEAQEYEALHAQVVAHLTLEAKEFAS